LAWKGDGSSGYQALREKADPHTFEEDLNMTAGLPDVDDLG